MHDAEVLYATLEGIATEIARENPDFVPMVFGCDDCHARMLSEAKPRLEEAGIIVPYIDFNLLDDITQKRRFYELCEELDIPYPKTWYFDCSDAGPDELPLDELPFPLIAKPSNSAQFQDAEPTVRDGGKSTRSKTLPRWPRFGSPCANRATTTSWCSKTSSPVAMMRFAH